MLVASSIAATALQAQPGTLPDGQIALGTSAPDSLSGDVLGEIGIGFVPALPVGEFKTFIDAGYGVGGLARVNLDPHGWTSLRADVGYISYGNTTTSRPLFEGDQRITVDIATENSIFTAGIGPQLTLAAGPVRPYIDGSAGFSYFATKSSATGTNNNEDFASSTNFSDITFATRAGGGLLIVVYDKDVSLSIDVGAHHVWNGRVQFLTEDSLVQRPDGSVYFLHSIEGEANMVMFNIGISIGVR